MEKPLKPPMLLIAFSLEYTDSRIIGLKSRVVFQCFKCPKNISFAVNFFTRVYVFSRLLFSRLSDVQMSEMGLYFPRSQTQLDYPLGRQIFLLNEAGKLIKVCFVKNIFLQRMRFKGIISC